MSTTDRLAALRDVNDQLTQMPAKELGKRLYHEVQEDEVTTRAAAFAYHWIFAIPPLLILTVMVASLLNTVTAIPVVENLRDLVGERAPADTQDLLLRLIDNAVAEVDGGLASFGVIATALLALWAGASAMGSMIDAFNHAYGVEEDRPFVRKKLLALGLTLLLAVGVNLAFALLVFGERIGAWLADRIGLGTAFDVVWALVRWPLALATIVVLLALLYYFGPNVEQSFRWISPGAVVATIGWLLAVLGFGIYLQFSNPGSAYGVLGSVIVLLFFLYVTGLVFLIGAEINAILGRRYDPETTRDLATSPKAAPEARSEARRRRAEAT